MSVPTIGPAVLTWLARLLSLLVLGMVALLFVGERANPIGVFRGTHGMCVLFPFGVFVGILLAWRSELAGSLVSLASLGVFYWVDHALSGTWPHGPWFMIFTSPAALFLAAWVWRSMSSPPPGSQMPRNS